jgi:hypothetical protein
MIQIMMMGCLDSGRMDNKEEIKKYKAQYRVDNKAIFQDPIRGKAYACYCEEQLQLKAA